MNRSLRLDIYSRVFLESRPGGIALAAQAREPDARFVRNPWDINGDYLVTIRPDPGSAVEPPGYVTAYVTGGEYPP